MTVNQLTKAFVKESEKGFSYNRKAIHKELFKDILKQFNGVPFDKRRRNASQVLNEIVSNINIKFMNVYVNKPNKENEWKIFYASFIIPLKVGLGIMSIDNNKNRCNEYIDITLTSEQKKAIVSTGLNKPKIDKDIIHNHMITILDALTEVFDISFEKLDDIKTISPDLYSSALLFIDNIGIIEAMLDMNNLKSIKTNGYVEKPHRPQKKKFICRINK